MVANRKLQEILDEIVSIDTLNIFFKVAVKIIEAWRGVVVEKWYVIKSEDIF